MKLIHNALMPEVYVHGRPKADDIDAAFARAFDAPRPAVFEGDDWETFDSLLGKQAVAILGCLERRDFSSKLSIYAKGEIDLAPPLVALSRDLGQPVVVDIGKDITDDSAVLFTPLGETISGLLISFGDEYPDETRDVAFIDAAGDRYVVA